MTAKLVISEHLQLGGLDSDDHTQYHTDARADTWFTGKDLNDLGTKNHADLDLLSADDHPQYLLVDGSRVMAGDLDMDGYDITNMGQIYSEIIYLDNDGGDGIVFPTAVSTGAATSYGMDVGGGGAFGGSNEGGTFTIHFDDIGTQGGTAVNQFIVDVGSPDVFAGTVTNDVIFKAYNGIATYGFVSAFGSWNGGEYGWALQRLSGSETQARAMYFDNQIPYSDINRSIDFRINGANKLTIENNGNIIVTDYMTVPRAIITCIDNGFGVGLAGTPAVTFTGYLNFFGLNWFDYLTFTGQTADLDNCIGIFPNGTATGSFCNVYNSSNTGAVAWLQMGVRGATAELVVRDFSQTTNITALNIGSGGNDFPVFDVTCSTLTDINFVFAGVTECTIKVDTLEFNNGAVDTQIDWGTSGELGLQVAATDILRLTASQVQCIQDLVISDAQNIVLDTTTGTEIGTATSQKLGFWGTTPVTQPTALTTALDQISHTGPLYPDYVIATPINSNAWGFTTQDEFETIMSVILNLQTRVDELESKLQSVGLLA